MFETILAPIASVSPAKMFHDNNVCTIFYNKPAGKAFRIFIKFSTTCSQQITCMTLIMLKAIINSIVDSCNPAYLEAGGSTIFL